MLTEIYILFIIDLMIPHNEMNSINLANFRLRVQLVHSGHGLLKFSGGIERLLCGCVIETDMRDGVLLQHKKPCTGTVARNAIESTGSKIVCDYVLVSHLTSYCFPATLYLLHKQSESHQIMWGIHKPTYAAQLKLSLLTPGLVKYEWYMRIYQTRYQISAPTLIFSLTSVTPCKLTHLVYPCKNRREIKNITLK